MRKMMNKVAGNMKVTVAKAAMLLKDKKGENPDCGGNRCPFACRFVCPLR